MNVSFEGISLEIGFIRWAGLLIALGAAAGLGLTYFEAKRRGADPALVLALFTPLVLWGCVGARLWYLLTPPLSAVKMGLTSAYYFSHPLDALALWVGGYGVPGLWLGVASALFGGARQNKTQFWELADVFAPGFVLAHAIGRLGDYFNQQLYGLPTRLPWGIFIAPQNRLAGFETAERYHPLFAYETLALAALFIWIMKRSRRDSPPGALILAYLAFYSALRFALEFLRLDVALAGGWNVNQVFFGAAFALTAARLYWISRATKRGGDA